MDKLKQYKINEIFYSIQGEGARAGSANIFVRFSDCNLTCNFCDTEFVSGKQWTAEALVEHLQSKFPQCKNIILTGGEPTLQVDSELCYVLKNAGYYLAIETNGSNKVPHEIDYVACSPKVAEHVLKKSFPGGVDELRYVRHSGQSTPEPQIKADHYYLSPQNNGDHINTENLRYCIQLCLENPVWKLSTQQHKMFKIL